MTDPTLETKLAVHEATSAARYLHIEQRLESGDKRMTRIEYMLGSLILIVLFGPGVAAEFIKKLLGI